MAHSSSFGRLTAEQRAIVLSRPYWRMRRFASLLGWNGLRMEWIAFTEEEAAKCDTVPISRILVSYLTTDAEFSIQINEKPAGQIRHYQAMVGPFRYGFRPIGWLPFELFDDDAALLAEAVRLRPWLARRQFRDPKLRAAFRAQHPELLLAGRKRK
jgi:hypothetical protein